MLSCGLLLAALAELKKSVHMVCVVTEAARGSLGAAIPLYPSLAGLPGRLPRAAVCHHRLAALWRLSAALPGGYIQ